MQDPITLKSGSELQVGLAPFAVGNRLLKTVARELAAVEFNMDFGEIDLSKVSAKDINTLKNAAFQLLQSEDVEKAVMECMKRCLYNGHAIQPNTFEAESARQDYLPVAWEVMKANLIPFFSGLDLPSSASAKPSSSDQKPA
jgi:hypothetical protein